ncbi:MAG: GTP cyclohydrolase I FolE [Devosiaceae bacterium]|nr:GTP cyclohydrolase I FolE [Devosiaceae bacterium]
MDVKLPDFDAKSKKIARVLRKPSEKQMQEAVKTLIAYAGDDPTREGVIDSPKRVAKAYSELFAGYEQDPKQILSKTFQDISDYNDIVLLRDIAFYSHCEHHLVPFFGKVHIAYLPNEGIVGLSKLARLVEIYARRLQTQENLTAQIIEALNTYLEPRGAAIMVEAEHMCMSMRGVRAPGATTLTQKFTGIFAEEKSERERFFALVNGAR